MIERLEISKHVASTPRSRLLIPCKTLLDPELSRIPKERVASQCASVNCSLTAATCTRYDPTLTCNGLPRNANTGRTLDPVTPRDTQTGRVLRIKSPCQGYTWKWHCTEVCTPHCSGGSFISTAKTWDGNLPLPRNQVSKAPTGALQPSRLRQHENTELGFLQRQVFV